MPKTTISALLPLRRLTAALVATLGVTGEASASGQWLGGPCGGAFPSASYSWYNTACWGENKLPTAGSDILLAIGVQPDVNVIFSDAPTQQLYYGNLKIANRDRSHPLRLIHTTANLYFSNVDIAAGSGEGGSLLSGGWSAGVSVGGSAFLTVSGTTNVGTGANSTGLLQIDGPFHFIKTANLNVGGASGSVGQLKMSGGSLTVTNALTLKTTSTVQITGGEWHVPSFVNNGYFATSGAWLDIEGPLPTVTNNGYFEYGGGQIPPFTLNNNSTLLGVSLKSDMRINGLVNNGMLASVVNRAVLTVEGAARNTGTLDMGVRGVLAAGGVYNSASGKVYGVVDAGNVQNAGLMVLRSTYGAPSRLGFGVNTGTLQLGGGAVNGVWIDNNSGGVVTAEGARVSALFNNHAGSTLAVGQGGLTFTGEFINEAGSTITIAKPAAGNPLTNLTFAGPTTLARGTRFTGALSTVALLGSLQLSGGTGAVEFDGVAYVNGGMVTLAVGGTSFDQLAGQLLFVDPMAVDTLVLRTTSGFVAQAGQSFHVLAFDRIQGQFDAIDTSSFAVASGAKLDLSQLHTGGTLSVVAVPEPATWATLCVGLGLLVCRRRKNKKPSR